MRRAVLLLRGGESCVGSGLRLVWRAGGGEWTSRVSPFLTVARAEKRRPAWRTSTKDTKGHEGLLFVCPHTLHGSPDKALPCFEAGAPLPQRHLPRFLPDRLGKPRTELAGEPPASVRQRDPSRQVFEGRHATSALKRCPGGAVSGKSGGCENLGFGWGMQQSGITRRLAACSPASADAEPNAPPWTGGHRVALRNPLGH